MAQAPAITIGQAGMKPLEHAPVASHPIDRLRAGLTVVATLALWSLLLWQHFHQGVPAHHLLDNPDLPVVSNWYGGLLLPVLAWGLLSLTRRRMIKANSPSLKPVVAGLAGGRPSVWP